MTAQQRKVFPGGHTAHGFHSFYDQITGRTARRVYIIKGGPGVGKATFMTGIADRISKLGQPVEYLCCASDTDSYDGVHFTSLKVALFDGTAPHVTDPRLPGVMDGIIDLDMFLDRKPLKPQRKRIIEATDEASRSYARAYDYLAIAKTARKMLNEQFLAVSDRSSADALSDKIIEDAFGSHKTGGRGRIRSMFASAIGSKGFVNHLDSITEGCTKRYVLKAPIGGGTAQPVHEFVEAALRRGHDVDVFCCCLQPEIIEHAVVPELGIAMLSDHWPHSVKPRPTDVTTELAAYADSRALAEHGNEIRGVEELFKTSLRAAETQLRNAKEAHDVLESIYSPCMDFAASGRLRDRILAEILQIANLER